MCSNLNLIERTEEVNQRCSVKKVLLEISQNSQENTCARVSFFNKVAGLRHHVKTNLISLKLLLLRVISIVKCH